MLRCIPGCSRRCQCQCHRRSECISYFLCDSCTIAAAIFAMAMVAATSVIWHCHAHVSYHCQPWPAMHPQLLDCRRFAAQRCRSVLSAVALIVGTMTSSPQFRTIIGQYRSYFCLFYLILPAPTLLSYCYLRACLGRPRPILLEQGGIEE